MKCKVCNAEIVEGANFCTMCGAKVQREVFCSQCGTKLSEGSKFCFNCGAAVVQQLKDASDGQVSSIEEDVDNIAILDEYSFSREYYGDECYPSFSYAYGESVIYKLKDYEGKLIVMDIESKSVIREIVFKNWIHRKFSAISVCSKGLILADNLMKASKVAFVSWEQVNSGEISINELGIYCTDGENRFVSTSICGEILYVLRQKNSVSENTDLDATDCTLEKINLATGEKSVIWNMVDCLDEFYNAVLEQTGAREGDSNLYKGRKSQMMDDISFHQSDVKYGYVGKNRAIIYYSIYAEGDKFYGRLSKLLSIDLNSLQQTVLCNDSRDEGDIRIARFDMKNDVMWLQKIDEDRYGGDILYKHKIQPLKVITNITNCIDSWTLPNGWGRFIKDMYFDGKCVYYPNGSKILFGGNDGKYSEWNDNAPVSSSYFSILGPWVHINCDTYIGEDVNDYFIPNRVKMAGEDEWLIIKNNIH